MPSFLTTVIVPLHRACFLTTKMYLICSTTPSLFPRSWKFLRYLLVPSMKKPPAHYFDFITSQRTRHPEEKLVIVSQTETGSEPIYFLWEKNSFFLRNARYELNANIIMLHQTHAASHSHTVHRNGDRNVRCNGAHRSTLHHIHSDECPSGYINGHSKKKSEWEIR